MPHHNSSTSADDFLFPTLSIKLQCMISRSKALSESLGKPSLRGAELYSPHCGKTHAEADPDSQRSDSEAPRWIGSGGFVIKASELIEIFQPFTNSYRGTKGSHDEVASFFSFTCLCTEAVGASWSGLCVRVCVCVSLGGWVSERPCAWHVRCSLDKQVKALSAQLQWEICFHKESEQKFKGQMFYPISQFF